MNFRTYFILLAALLLSACSSIGPSEIDVNRSHYNDAIRNTQAQELLRNIVRLRYCESTYFLNISNVTASYVLTPALAPTNTGIGMSTQQGVGTSRFAQLGPALTYTDAPTISYNPITNADFVNQLLTPVELKYMHFLLYGGVRDPDLLFRLVIQRLNEMDNASSISSPKASTVPIYEHYYRFLKLLKKILVERTAILLPSEVNGEKKIVVKFIDGKENSRDAMALKRMLEVPLNSKFIIFSIYKMDEPNVVYVQTRSALGILNYLSHAVQVPQADLCSGKAPVYRGPDGCPLDFSELFSNLFAVYTSDSEPKDAYVKVFVNNHWFYIKDCDTDSKLTFNFIGIAILMQSGNSFSGNTTAPIVTIPIR